MHGKIDFSVLKVTAATSAALLASGCGGGQLVANQPTQLCVDRGQRVPEMGEVARGGSIRPSAGVSYSSASRGSVSRGGFGRSAGFHGGFGGG